MSLLSTTDDSVKSTTGIHPGYPHEEVQLEILKKREEIQKKSEEIVNKSEECAQKKRESINKLEKGEEAEMPNENTLPRAASTRRHSKRLVCIASHRACCSLCPLFRVIHGPLLPKVKGVFTSWRDVYTRIGSVI